jgi:hypothetical protein
MKLLIGKIKKLGKIDKIKIISRAGKSVTGARHLKPDIPDCQKVKSIAKDMDKAITKEHRMSYVGTRVGNKGAKPVKRTGPKGVDPEHHNLNVMVRDSEGAIKSHERIVSGNMTAEEKAMGYPKGQNASHTEARFARYNGDTLVEGDTVTMTGQLPPCNSCKGYMNRLAEEKNVDITYRWREDGVTKVWKAKRKI